MKNKTLFNSKIYNLSFKPFSCLIFDVRPIKTPFLFNSYLQKKIFFYKNSHTGIKREFLKEEFKSKNKRVFLQRIYKSILKVFSCLILAVRGVKRVFSLKTYPDIILPKCHTLNFKSFSQEFKRTLPACIFIYLLLFLFNIIFLCFYSMTRLFIYLFLKDRVYLKRVKEKILKEKNRKKRNADVPQAPTFTKWQTYIFTHRISIFKKHYTLKTLFSLYSLLTLLKNSFSLNTLLKSGHNREKEKEYIRKREREMSHGGWGQESVFLYYFLRFISGGICFNGIKI